MVKLKDCLFFIFIWVILIKIIFTQIKIKSIKENKTMSYSAFVDTRLLATGKLETVITKVKQDFPNREALLIETDSCKRLDINWQGTLDEVLSRLSLTKSTDSELSTHESSDSSVKPKRGRPKLGVVSKEVTLLPRHWEWLSQQSGGASVTLRRLVDKARQEARQESGAEDETKRQQNQLYKFISIFAEQLPDVEEAMRALYRQDGDLFIQSIQNWPTDIRQFCENKFVTIPTLAENDSNE